MLGTSEDEEMVGIVTAPDPPLFLKKESCLNGSGDDVLNRPQPEAVRRDRHPCHRDRITQTQHQVTAGAQHARQLVERPVEMFDEVQRVQRHRRVEGVVGQWQILKTCLVQDEPPALDVAAVTTPRAGQHGARYLDTVHAAARPQPSQQQIESASAAEAQVSNLGRCGHLVGGSSDELRIASVEQPTQ